MALTQYLALRLAKKSTPSTNQEKTTMLAPTAALALRVASRGGRSMSTAAAAAPKIHKYKDAAPELMKTRPPPGHDHVSSTTRGDRRRGSFACCNPMMMCRARYLEFS
jgi:hypothetical protein